MSDQAFHYEHLPQVTDPILIGGFDGWGNALDVSKSMASYLIRKLAAEKFAEINPDLFYRFDETRPYVDIQGGRIKSVSPPGGSFYAAHTEPSKRGIIILMATEPSLRWKRFVNDLLDLCEQLGVTTIVTLGSMYDRVLHSDVIISGIASSEALVEELRSKKVIPINYQGPSAIHSLIQMEGQKKGLRCISLWCHCPYYLQGATHFGALSGLGSLLASIGHFELDTEELERSWKELNRQIEALVEKNPELEKLVNDLKKERIRGSWESRKGLLKKDDKIIHLEDFLRPP